MGRSSGILRDAGKVLALVCAGGLLSAVAPIAHRVALGATMPAQNGAPVAAGATLDPGAQRPVLVQDSSLTLEGTVRDETDTPIVATSVVAEARGTSTDSLGRFALTRLPEGRVRVSVRRIGYERLDTTIVLHAGRTARLDVVLHPTGLLAAARKADSDAEAAGRVDSSALGLLHPTATSVAPALTFGPFGARLLSAAVGRRDPDSNTVLSPVSAGLALSLALLGARGSTAAALASVLGTAGLDRPTLERRGGALLAAARGRTDVQLEIASAIWVDSAARLAPGFAASAAMWQATVGTLRLAAPAAIVPINRWADSVTHGKIPSILVEPLPDTTVLFLANAVYFKGRWLDPFEKSATRPRDFTLGSGRRVRVPAMEQRGSFAYRREPGYQVVRLPYRGGRTALYVILPDSGVALGALERQFAARGWPGLLVARDKRDVHLVLPKLHVELALDLKPLLDTLGAGIALDCRRADFRDLAVASASNEVLSLCVGRAVQRVYLEVDEEGTEAAAVTGLAMMGFTAVPPPPLDFIVDRPFLFVLRDEQSGADLFVGSIRRP